MDDSSTSIDCSAMIVLMLPFAFIVLPFFLAGIFLLLELLARKLRDVSSSVESQHGKPMSSVFSAKQSPSQLTIQPHTPNRKDR